MLPYTWASATGHGATPKRHDVRVMYARLHTLSRGDGTRSRCQPRTRRSERLSPPRAMPHASMKACEGYRTAIDWSREFASCEPSYKGEPGAVSEDARAWNRLPQSGHRQWDGRPGRSRTAGDRRLVAFRAGGGKARDPAVIPAHHRLRRRVNRLARQDAGLAGECDEMQPIGSAKSVGVRSINAQSNRR